MKPVIYSIGYSGFSRDDFLQALESHEITAVIDVRSNPYSKHYTDYNRDVLESYLKKHNIYYRNYALQFGARQDNTHFYSKEGYLDFIVFSKSKQFTDGVSQICEGMQKGFTFVLMCAEKNPIDCHRTILVARAFHALGYSVIHLLPNNHCLTQSDIDRQLIEMYFPNHNQVNFFDSEQSDDILLDKAYIRRNVDIGYYFERDML